MKPEIVRIYYCLEVIKWEFYRYIDKLIVL